MDEEVAQNLRPTDWYAKLHNFFLHRCQFTGGETFAHYRPKIVLQLYIGHIGIVVEYAIDLVLEIGIVGQRAAQALL